MKKMSLCAAAIAALLASGCASKHPIATATDKTAAGIYTDKDSFDRAAAVMEFYKRTNQSLSHNSDLALAVGGEITNALREILINVAYPSVVASEFTARGEIDMINEGVRVSKREKRNIVLFLDIQVRKRGKTGEGDKNVNVSIDSWAIDAKKKKIIAKLSKEGYREMGPDARLADVDLAVRETLIDTAREIGREISRLLNDYLPAA
ncbi:MAG: hypothetical protein HZA01_17205 [Nitrospinae bacterium]|nr:hypothetical protein [Nitrospinota bacterium]